MKRPFTLLAMVLLFAAACKKGDGEVVNTLLIGKWKVIGNYLSAGGPMYYVPYIQPDPAYATFAISGAVGGTVFTDMKTYTLKDSTTITMTKDDKVTYQNFYYKINKDTLRMSPNGPKYCFEGCAIILVKVK